MSLLLGPTNSLTKSGFWVSLYTIKGSWMSMWRDFYFLYPKINRSASILTSLSSQMRREPSAPTCVLTLLLGPSTSLTKMWFLNNIVHNKDGWISRGRGCYFLFPRQPIWLDFDIPEFTHIRREPNDLTCAYVFATKTNEFPYKEWFLSIIAHNKWRLEI